tara:strand:- start:7975 stop:9837 length:1863 start_codon:yes stop_codon:yes gene_type:complete
MTGYRIGRVVATNFLPFEHVEVDLSLPGLTVIEGEMLDADGCSSNGSGKSSLLEAPVWAITGKCIREGYRGDDVVRIGSEGGACVDVTLVGGTHEVRVVRYRKHKTHRNKVFLYIDGEDVSAGTTTQTDQRIETELGLDYDTFLSTVAFGARADVKSFYLATDADRKRILSRLLGLDVFEQARKLVRDHQRAATARLDALMTEQLNFGMALQEDERRLHALSEEHGVDPIEVNIARARVAMARRRVAKLRSELEEWTEERQQARERLDRLTEFVEARRERLERRARRREKAAREARRRLDAATDRADRLSSTVKRIEAMQDADCPTCLRPLSPEEAKPILEALREELTALRADAAKIEDEIRTREGATKITIPDPSPRDFESMRYLERATRVDLQLAEAALSGFESALEPLLRAASSHGAQTQDLEGQIKKTRAKIEDIERQQAEVQGELESIRFWESGFSNRGLMNYLIEAELPRINEAATDFASRLLGEGTTVEIDPTRELKKSGEVREEVDISAQIPGCAATYAGASKGQRHRLDLAILLAFRAVVADRCSAAFDQLMCDELFDGIDEAGVECVVEILRELSADCPVVLVTHDPRLKSVGDRVITVRHEGGSARVVG